MIASNAQKEELPGFNSNIMNVAYFCSDLFAEPCAVSIASLFENNKEFDEIEVFIIHDKISTGNQNRINIIAETYNRQIFFIPMPEPEEYFKDKKFSIATLGHTFGRMIIGNLLPDDVTRVICLDSDTLILDSLYKLWNIDLKNCYIAGVEGAPGVEIMKKTLHIEPGTLYCNAGLFLMDLVAIRHDKIEIKYQEYIKKTFNSGKLLGFYEEEVINKCTYPKILKLPPEYNLQTISIVMDYDSFIKFRGAINYYTKEEMEKAIEHPVVVHAINTFYVQKRIWEKDSDSPYASEYTYYRSKTPWEGMPQIESNRSAKQMLMKKIWHIMPKKVAFWTAALVRNKIRPFLSKQRDDE